MTEVLGDAALPVPQDCFFGRHDVRDAVAERLRTGDRLVTLHGPGGMGKTRLSLEVARDLVRALPGGVVFCDLSAATDTHGIVGQVAACLGLPPDGDTLDERVGHALAARDRSLLVLDNLEQVATVAGTTVARWLQLAPELRVLATSRVPLRIRSERTVGLDPLAGHMAVALFRDRAGDTVDDEDVPDIQRLVAALDGLPLAIELAAARARMLSPAAILERLRDRFRLLRSGDTDRPARHQTLEASIDGSWELLNPAEQHALCQLATLEAPSSLATCEAVLELGAWPDAWPLDVLDALVEHSLLRREGDRFRVLASVRDYAIARTPADVRRAAEARHGARFAQLGSRRALGALATRGGEVRTARLARVLPDLVAACRRAVARGDGPVAAATAMAATVGLQMRGPIATLVELLEAVVEHDLAGSRRPELLAELARWLDRVGGSAGDLARAEALATVAVDEARAHGDVWTSAQTLLTRGNLTRAKDRPQAAAADLREAIVAFDAAGDLPRRLHAQVALATLIMYDGRPGDALELIDEVVAIYEVHGSAYELARAESNRSMSLRQLGRLEEAAEGVERALRFHRRLGASRSEAIAAGNLALLWATIGRNVEADAMANQSLELYRHLGERAGVARAYGTLGVVAGKIGRAEQARDHFRQALKMHREMGDHRQAGVTLSNLGVVALEFGDMQGAQSLLEEALQSHRDTNYRRFVGVTLGNLGVALVERGELVPARAALAEALEVHRECGNVRSEGIALAELASLDLEEGDHAAAHTRILESIALLEQVGDQLSLGRTRVTYARVLRAAGRTDEALGALDAAVDALGPTHNVMEVARALSERAATLSDLDPELAEAAMVEAERLIEDEPETMRSHQLREMLDRLRAG